MATWENGRLLGEQRPAATHLHHSFGLSEEVGEECWVVLSDLTTQLSDIARPTACPSTHPPPPPMAPPPTATLAHRDVALARSNEVARRDFGCLVDELVD